MTAAPLEVKKAQRALFMRRLYDKSDGAAMEFITADTLTADMHLSESQEQELVDYLKQEGLIKSRGTGSPPLISITHRGVIEVEQSSERPELPTEHFPPVSAVLNVYGDVVGSNIAQASPQTTQTVTYTSEQRQDLMQALQQVRALLAQGLPDADDEQALRSDVQTIDAQLASSRPNSTIVHAAVGSIVNVLTVLTGDSQLAQAALEGLRPFLGV